MITLYSIGCRNCKILEARLKRDNIDFVVSDDIDKLIELGFQSAPVLQINDEYIDFPEAMGRLKALENGEGTIE